MVSNPPKVSFIPKSPLSQEESFLLRRRPKSITGFIAIFMFVGSIGLYAGLYLYENTLADQLTKNVEDIAKAQRSFLQSPEIAQARVFKAQADLARELLDQHIIISPVFAFLSDNTLKSILFDSFSFKRDKDSATLSLTGEAPSYASLAYQAVVLREKNKLNEFVSFAISNITLTKSGSVTFALTVEFSQSQLSYTKKSTAASPETIPVGDISVPALSSVKTDVSPKKEATSTLPVFTPPSLVPSSVPLVSTTTTVTSIAPDQTSPSTIDASGWTVSPIVATSSSPAPAKPAPAPVPAKSSFWSWFKFW